MIHKTFGKRKPVTYTDRPGAYLIPVEMHRAELVFEKGCANLETSQTNNH